MFFREAIMKKYVIFFLAALFTSISGFAQTDITITISQIPPLSKEFHELVNLMQKEYKDGKFIILGEFPYVRSVNNIIIGKADLHMPALYNEVAKKNVKDYIFSTENLTIAPFVLYAKKNVAGLNAKTAYKFRMCTDRGHVQYFDFKIEPVDNYESTLEMVNIGRMDGFIFSMVTVDPLLKKSGLKNIKRVLYQNVEVKMIFPNNKRGQEIDKIVSPIIRVLKKKGVCPVLLEPAFYTDWQMQ
jgi:polar amino acid transport system substrate-binding protein